MVVIYLGLARSYLYRYENKMKNITSDMVEENYKKCISFQQKVINEVKQDKTELVQESNKLYADICYEYGCFLEQ